MFPSITQDILIFENNFFIANNVSNFNILQKWKQKLKWQKKVLNNLSQKFIHREKAQNQVVRLILDWMPVSHKCALHDYCYVKMLFVRYFCRNILIAIATPT